MKIGILTQPLRGNYGGVLQNWALQHILIRLGHEPITIDILPRPSIGRFILSTIKSLLLWFIPSRRRRFKRWRERRMPLFEEFVSKNIIKTPTCRNYSMEMIREYGLEALLVGSDQTWRPIYNVNRLSDMFLHFAGNFSRADGAFGRKISPSCFLRANAGFFHFRNTSVTQYAEIGEKQEENQDGKLVLGSRAGGVSFRRRAQHGAH